MTSKSSNGILPALFLTSAVLTGCQTMQNAGESISTGFNNLGNTIGQGASDLAGEVGGFVVPTNIAPTLNAIRSEYCVAGGVVSAFGGGQISQYGNLVSDIYAQTLTPEDRAQSLYCDQNLGGAILVMDKSTDRALDEASKAIAAAGSALDTKLANQEDVLARLARMQNLTIGDKLDSAYIADMEALNEEMAILEESAEQELTRLSEEGGVTPEVKERLETAHKHFVTFGYYRGKSITGVTILTLAYKKHGERALAAAFVEAVKIDAQRAQKEGKPDLESTGKLVKAFVGSVPKLVQAMSRGGGVSRAIWKAADTGGFEEDLRALNTPADGIETDMITFADDINLSAESLGLPTVSSL